METLLHKGYLLINKTGNCGASLDDSTGNNHYSNRNQGIVLSDMNQSPYIMCTAGPSMVFFNDVN